MKPTALVFLFCLASYVSNLLKSTAPASVGTENESGARESKSGPENRTPRRVSALFKVVSLLELDTSRDAGYQEEHQECGLHDSLRSPKTLRSGMSVSSLAAGSMSATHSCRVHLPCFLAEAVAPVVQIDPVTQCVTDFHEMGSSKFSAKYLKDTRNRPIYEAAVAAGRI